MVADNEGKGRTSALDGRTLWGVGSLAAAQAEALNARKAPFA
jgi:hypothetical protein